jgi:putative methylase
MMRRRSLEIVLSKLKDIPAPKPHLEQYRTPDTIVSDIAYFALGNGSIEGKRVLEPGCGGAPFLIAAGLLGAVSLVGIDVDPDSVRIAWQNIEDVDRSLGTDLASISEIIERDVAGYVGEDEHDTVLMNPPFGSQKKGADRPFLDVATGTGGEIYSIHNSRGIDFVRDRLRRADYRIVEEREYLFPLPHRFFFHADVRSETTAILLHSKPPGQ